MGGCTTVSDWTCRLERLLGQCHGLGEWVRGWRPPPEILTPALCSFTFLQMGMGLKMIQSWGGGQCGGWSERT